MAAAHAQAKVNAARAQLEAKAGSTDYVSEVDMRANAVLRAPAAQPQPPAQPVAAGGGMSCSGCGAVLAAGVKFCPQCGVPCKGPGCPGCGAAIQAGTKFCGQCGARFG